jgi:hypothetical protein
VHLPWPQPTGCQFHCDPPVTSVSAGVNFASCSYCTSLYRRHYTQSTSKAVRSDDSKAYATAVCYAVNETLQWRTLRATVNIGWASETLFAGYNIRTHAKCTAGAVRAHAKGAAGAIDLHSKRSHYSKTEHFRRPSYVRRPCMRPSDIRLCPTAAIGSRK